MKRLRSAFHSVPTGLLLVGLLSILRPAGAAPEAGLTAPDLATVLAIPAPQDRLQALAAYGADLPLAAIKGALARAETLTELRERAVLREAIVQHWAQREPAAAFAFVARRPGSQNQINLLRAITQQFARTDPMAAAAAATALPGGRTRDEVLPIVAEAWARVDVVAARSWIATLPANPTRDLALRNLLFIWVHADPSAAAAVVVDLPPGNIRNALLTNVAGDWATTDPLAAFAWARQLGTAADQELALRHATESWADHDPSAVAHFLRALPAAQHAACVPAVAERWATQDPARAAAWALTQPSPGAPAPGLDRALSVWASEDPAAAVAWIAQLAASPTRDFAIQAFVDAALDWAPAAATRAANLIEPLAQRQSTLEACLRRWIESDPRACEAWLRSSNLPPAWQTTWLRSLFPSAQSETPA